MADHPEADPNDVIERLRSELAQNRETIRQVQVVLRSDPMFDGLSVIGGVKAILKALHNQQDENRELDRELRKHIARA